MQGASPNKDQAEETDTIRIPDGTPVRLLIDKSISSKAGKPNDPVPLRVIDEVKAGDLVLIANKAPALASIAEIKRARRVLRAGTMSIKLHQVTLVTGETHKLRGATASEGGAVGYGSGGVDNEVSLLLAVFSLPFLPLAHGNEAILPKGTVLTAALDGDAVLDRASVIAHQPMPAPRKDGPASITFYWPNNGSRGGDRISCGKVNLGKLSTGRNFAIHLPAGSYWFSMSNKKTAASLAAESGGEYFVRVLPLGLRPIEHDMGEAEASETRPLAPGRILDINSTSLHDLQADPRRKK